MISRNKKILNSLGVHVFKFEMIAKDCDLFQKDFQSWGLIPSEGKKHVMFLTETQSKLNQFITILDINNVNFNYKDITNSIIYMMDLDPLFKRAYDYNSSFKWSIDKIRRSKLTIDDVLDKINIYGELSLDNIDKEILKNTKL
jgi:hypothetical protein